MPVYCPQCRYEHRDGFVTCSDCQARLVSQLPANSEGGNHQPPDFSSNVDVFEISDNFALCAATGCLEEAGINYLVDDEPSGPLMENLSAKHTWWIHPCRIKVAPQEEKEARELLDTFQNPDFTQIDHERRLLD